MLAHEVSRILARQEEKSEKAPKLNIAFKPGDQVNVEVHEGGTITLTPLRPKPSRAEVSRVIKATMKDYARTMKKLA